MQSIVMSMSVCLSVRSHNSFVPSPSCIRDIVTLAALCLDVGMNSKKLRTA